MLQAKNEKGEFVTLFTLTKEKIAVLKKTSQFFCPTCHEKVQIKAGKTKIPHFAHLPKSDCPARVGGEGPYHLAGKLQLYYWLKQQTSNVLLEPYIREINQRPDILMYLNKRKIVIEFQCATTSVSEIRTRTISYQSLGIKPIWIMGAMFFKRIGPNYIKISPFILQFIHQFHSTFPPSLYFYCPKSKQVVVANDILICTPQKAIAKLHFFKINQVSFSALFKLSTLKDVEKRLLWKREKKRFRMKPRGRAYGKEREWLQWLYFRKTHIETLPSIVYLPVQSQHKMITPLWNWQSRIYVDILAPLHVGEVFSVQSCEFLLQNHQRMTRHHPLIESSRHPIHEYLQWLVYFNYLMKVSRHHYKILKIIKSYHNIEHALAGDQLLLADRADRTGKPMWIEEKSW